MKKSRELWRELQKVTDEIEGRVEEKAEEALVNSERMMEKECNEKIMAISEYSDTVVESMNKTHNEIMFLYSMLNDKHAELTDFSAKLNELAKELEKKDEAIVGHLSYSAPFEEKRTRRRRKGRAGGFSDGNQRRKFSAGRRCGRFGRIQSQRRYPCFA